MGGKTKTSITPETRKNMKPRGRDKRVLILESIREASLLDLSPDSTEEEAEKAYFTKVAERAVDDKDPSSGMLMKSLLDRMAPALKPSGERLSFEFDPRLTPSEKADQIILAASDGDMPPEVAGVFIGAIASMIKIEEVTTVKDRLDKVEIALGLVNG